MQIKSINNFINYLSSNHKIQSSDISDGYHTFGELYEFRMFYNAILLNELYKNDKKNILQIHKSKKHNDGEKCFNGKYFIVSCSLPSGQITNHYKLEHWNLFKIPYKEKCLIPFDGHTPKDVIERMKEYITQYQ